MVAPEEILLLTGRVADVTEELAASGEGACEQGGEELTDVVDRLGGFFRRGAPRIVLFLDDRRDECDFFLLL